MMKLPFFPACFLLFQLGLIIPVAGQHMPYIRYLDDPWVDSVMNTLSTREQIAQLVWIAPDGERDPARVVAIDHLIREEGIGGILFSQVANMEDLEEVSYYRSLGSVPLAAGLMTVEGSHPAGGLLGDFPDAVTLASITGDSLLFEAGSRLAARLASCGFQLLLEPAREHGITGVNIGEACREQHFLLSSSYVPGTSDAFIEREVSMIPGFRGVVAADEAGTAGLAFCFTADPAEVRGVIGELESLVQRGALDAGIIAHRVRMVLAFKFWAGLNRPAMEEPGRTHDTGWEAMLRELYASSVTVLNNAVEVIPVHQLDRTRIATLAVRAPSLTAFQRMAGNYTRIDHYHWMPGDPSSERLLEQLREYDLILLAIYPGTDSLGELEHLQKLLQDWSSPDGRGKQVISVVFSGVEELTRCLPAIGDTDGLVLTYQRNNFTEELAAQLIFGGIGANGRLPVAAGTRYPAGTGLLTPGNLRLQFAFPESAGISSSRLHAAIDSIVNAGLEAGAYPGCEVMAARKGKVIFHRSYGYHTYDRRIAVGEEDLYDLASVTKVSGPLSGLMVMEGMGQFSYRETLGTYCPEMKRSDKATLPLKDILAHQAGLYPWIPYWQDAVRKNGEYRHRFLRYTEEPKYPLTVADHLYLRYNFNRRIFKTIRKSELGERTYLYSGLAFFLFPGVIEDLSGERYEDFLYDHVYHRIGAWDLVFNPLRFYTPQRIVPTEYDSLFRKQQVHGTVHDEGAAMMGGYSGNAGLFATAGDLLKLMEMYRRMGNYGGEQIIAEEVLRQYTGYQFPELKNRRGLGFDKPLLDERDGTSADYPCRGATPSSFGHSGFTGTFVWVDPEKEITYVFLSNRVYPTRENNLLSEMDIRTSILQSIYDAIEPGN